VTMKSSHKNMTQFNERLKCDYYKASEVLLI